MQRQEKSGLNNLSGNDRGAPLGETSRRKKRPPKQNDFLDITAMIRSLQRSEGNADCFRRGHIDCDQLECVWRAYCLNPK